MILPSFSQWASGKIALAGFGTVWERIMRTVVYCTILAAMWGGGTTLVITYLLDFIDGAPRLSHLLVGGMLVAFSTVALAMEVAELLAISPKARARAQSQSLATQPLESVRKHQ
jgi:hypothetical protein